MTGGSTPLSDTRVRRNSPNRDSSSKKPSNTPLPIHVDDPMRVGQVLADATARSRPRHRNRPDAMGLAGHARHERVDVGLVLEEVRMAPRAFRRVVNRA